MDSRDRGILKSNVRRGEGWPIRKRIRAPADHPKYGGLVLVRFENPVFALHENQIEFESDDEIPDFEEGNEVHETMLKNAKTQREWELEELQRVAHVHVKHQGFSHCSNCDRRGSSSGVKLHVEKCKKKNRKRHVTAKACLSTLKKQCNVCENLGYSFDAGKTDAIFRKILIRIRKDEAAKRSAAAAAALFERDVAAAKKRLMRETREAIASGTPLTDEQAQIFASLPPLKRTGRPSKSAASPALGSGKSVPSAQKKKRLQAAA